jgi:ABC-type lipoprotein export system ATPase subunit
MIELKQVNKIYKCQKNVRALKNVSLSFTDTGMVFILGKSGSGKSTLLNLIGGIDECSSGEIFFRGSNICTFNQRQVDYYRNYHIGFVFQEFNLINQLSVEDNISVALEIQNHKRDKVKSKILDSLLEVDMEGFGNRKASNLSGGEKQRISIARALIKKPEIILADEPTGNLDLDSGSKILAVLKKLSKERLIIVVTHDKESAYKYGDRVITLSDGEITSDKYITNKSNNTNKYVNKSFDGKTISGTMTIALLFKLIMSFIKVKPLRQLLTFIIFCFALFLINLGLIYYCYDFNKVTMNIFQDSEITQIAVYKTNEQDYDVFYNSLSQEEINRIANENSDISLKKMISRQITTYGFFNSIFMPFKVTTDAYSDVLSFSNIILIDNDNKYDILYGSKLMESGDILISDYSAFMIVKYDIFPDTKDMSSLIGKSIFDGQRELRICGIIDTDYELYYNESNSYSELYDNGFSVNQSLYYSAIYTTNQTYDEILHTTGNYLHLVNGNTRNTLIASPHYDFEDMLIGEYPINEDEVVISLSVLELYLGQIILAGDITGNPQEISQYIGHTVNLDLTAYDQGIKSFTITGILDDFNRGNNVHIVFSQEEFEYLDYNNYSDGLLLGLLIEIDPRITPYNNLIDILVDNDLRHHTIYSSEIYSMDSVVENIVPIIEIFGGILILISLIIMSSHLSYSILVKSKEIGILRSLGVHKLDIIKIYMLQNSVLIVLSYIISILMTMIMLNVQNQEITDSWNLSVGILYIDKTIYLYGIMLILLINVISSIFPTLKLSNLPPLSAIRST